MPRKSRLDAPGALHHIMVRGIDRKAIFTDQKDYSTFTDRLGDLLIETRTSCYAWALIPNHFHLLLRTGSDPLFHLMKRLLTGYAVNFNRRHRRYGHLFQNRYKSNLCPQRNRTGQTFWTCGRGGASKSWWLDGSEIIKRNRFISKRRWADTGRRTVCWSSSEWGWREIVEANSYLIE